MTKKIDIEGMSNDEMWQLNEEITRLLSVQLTMEKRTLEKRLNQLRREKGLYRPGLDESDRSEVGSRARRKYPEVFPKYRNPNEPYETWSGRGKQPRWLTAALKTGHRIEEFAISNVGAKNIEKSSRRGRRA
jgi:DNA-binding protein H-NS